MNSSLAVVSQNLLLCKTSERGREEYFRWRDMIAPLLELEVGITTALRAAAAQHGVSKVTLQRKFYAVRRNGWDALLDRRHLGPDHWNRREDVGLPRADIELFKQYAEKNQRCLAAGWRKLLADWRAGKVKAAAPMNGNGLPESWSERNFYRYKPTRFELKAARIGRTAAASERALVYTTRRDLYVGQFYLFDDLWHDHFVNVLDQRKAGRPLEFHCLDLASACKFAWGMRVRMEREDGMDSLKEADMRFLLAYVLSAFGYNPRGTTLVVEHGTAAIRDWLEAMLSDLTGGAVKVARSGMTGAAAHAGQYAGRSKGNFRFKASLESLGNLIHNAMAYLPGQTGKDRDHRPEQLHGLLKYNDALLCALAQLPPERTQWLQWPLCTIQQFLLIAEEVYAWINARTEHDLEGWDARYMPDRRTGGMRRLAPVEVWRPGMRELVKFPPEAVARILSKDAGVTLTTRSNMFALENGEISGDPLRFDASTLRDREKYRVVVNPFYPEALYAFDAAGRLQGVCPRLHSVCRGEIEAVHRACGAAAKTEAELLLPLRARHMAEARAKTVMHDHNAAVLGGRPITEEEKQRERLTSRRIAAERGSLDDLEPRRPAPSEEYVENDDLDKL